MTKAAVDSDIVTLKDGVRIMFRSSRSGHLSNDIVEDLEYAVAESLADFLRAGDYRWSRINTTTNKRVLTENFEHGLDMLQQDYAEIIRYTHVEPREDLKWALHIHPEEASAAVIVILSAEVTQQPDERK